MPIDERDMPGPPVGAGEETIPLTLPPAGQIPATGIDVGTIRFRGRPYSVKAFPPALPRVDGGRPVYFLRGARGALYRSMRNVPNPDRLFVYGSGRTCATLGWLSDAGGTLRVIS